MSSTLSGSGLRWWIWGSAVASFVGVLAVGWLTPVRGWLYGLFLGANADWSLPALVLVGVSFVASAIVMAIVLRSGNFTRSDWRSSPFKDLLRVLLEMSSRRECDHPRHHSSRQHSSDRESVPMCGVGAGASLGVAGLLLGFMLLVMPLEVDTLSALLLAEARLDKGLESGMPPSLERRRPTGEAPLLAGDGAKGELVLDAFGNAITYERSTSDSDSAYTLRSFGPDGSWSSDDLCVHGHTQDLPVAGQLGDADEFQQALEADRVGWSERLMALKQSRCNNVHRLTARAARLRAE